MINQETYTIEKPKPHRMWVIWLLFFFQFAGVGAYFTFLNVYYHKVGLTGTQIGVLNMISSLVGMGGAVFWGIFADRTGKNRLIIAVGALGAILSAQLIPLVHGFWSFFAITLGGSLFSSSMNTLLDSTTLVMLGERRENYGRYRLGGSIGYILTGSSVGFLYDRIGRTAMFPVYGGLLLAFMLLALLLPNLPVRREARDNGAIGLMIRQPAWLLFMGAIFLYWVAYMASLSFLGVVLQSMGASQSLIGMALTIGAVIELPFMAFYGNLSHRFGPRRLLLVAMILSVIRYFFLGWMKVPGWAIAINMLNGPAYALFWNSAVNYANRLSPSGLVATAQGLLNFNIGLAGVLSGLVTGILFDRLGGGVFVFMAFCCLAALILFAAGTLQSMRQKTQPAGSE